MSYAAEVAADSPTSYWRLGETSGTNANDEVSTNDGTYTGGVTLNQTGALDGDPDPAVLLDGSNDHVTVPNVAALQITGSLTVEFWLKVTALDGSRRVIWQKTNYDREGAILLEPAASLNFYYGNGSSSVNLETPSSIISAGVWYHCVAVRDFDADLIKWYVNGTLRASTATQFEGTVASGSGAFLIGNGYTGNTTKGLLDEFAVYPSALSATRIGVHYTTGVPVVAPKTALLMGTG